MVLLDDFVKEWGKSVEALVAASVDANTGVGPLAARENTLLEGVSKFVLFVLAGVPHVTCQHLRKE